MAVNIAQAELQSTNTRVRAVFYDTESLETSTLFTTQAHPWGWGRAVVLRHWTPQINVLLYNIIIGPQNLNIDTASLPRHGGTLTGGGLAWPAGLQ